MAVANPLLPELAAQTARGAVARRSVRAAPRPGGLCRPRGAAAAPELGAMALPVD